MAKTSALLSLLNSPVTISVAPAQVGSHTDVPQPIEVQSVNPMWACTEPFDSV